MLLLSSLLTRGHIFAIGRIFYRWQLRILLLKSTSRSRTRLWSLRQTSIPWSNSRGAHRRTSTSTRAGSSVGPLPSQRLPLILYDCTRSTAPLRLVICTWRGSCECSPPFHTTVCTPPRPSRETFRRQILPWQIKAKARTLYLASMLMLELQLDEPWGS